MDEKQRDTKKTALTSPTVEDMVSVEVGARGATGIVAFLLLIVPFCWSLFQLWIASPLPFDLNILVLNEDQAKVIHLCFAVFLTFLAFPARKHHRSTHVPILDWLFAVLGVVSAGYLLVFHEALATRPGAPIPADIIAAVIGICLLLEATRRALGMPLMVVAFVFLVYTFAGPFMPDVIAHKGASLSKVMSHQWLSTQGVFGVALGVSTSFVFLFVLFGALLDRAGAGAYFIKVAYALLGHMRGGPAKAAVVSSGLSGLISGSSIANVVTTGTFTIPLMKRVGFSAEKAGAIEVAASTNGQLTPPIMGAAAFLMVEYVGISYLDVVRHAILPALISYIALLYIVHLEAVKMGMQGIERLNKPSLASRALVWMTVIIGVALVSGAAYVVVAGLKSALGSSAFVAICGLLLLAYVGLVWYAAQYPELQLDDPETDVTQLPEVGPTVKAGLHFLLPVVVLVWMLGVEQYSPALSAFWATVALIFIVSTQRFLFSWFRGQSFDVSALMQGISDCFHAFVSGARNMVGIGVATAAAGIVVGTVTLTGIGLVMTELVELVSGGNLLLMLTFTAVISLILGMGLPTTANYIVVSTLMAPVIVSLGAQYGLIVPLIAVHLFVFYFGILADDTPPVGLAAYAAAAISGADPIRTGVQGFAYDIRTAILPFMFIYNTQLLLIGLTGWFDLLVTVVGAVIAMLAFAAATQGFWLVKSRWYEGVGLLLVAFTLFRPGFWWDEVYSPMVQHAPTEMNAVIDSLRGEPLRMIVEGETLDGRQVSRHVQFVLGNEGSATDKLYQIGLELRTDDAGVWIDNLVMGSEAEKKGLDFDWKILSLETSSDRPPKELMYIPALMLLGLLALLQLRRKAAKPA